MRSFIDKVLGQLKEFFGKLTKKEKIRLLILVLLIIVLAIVAVIMLGRTKYVDLFTDIPANEAGAILDVLDQMNVPTKTPDSWTIQVPEDRAEELRMRLQYQGYNNSSAPTDLSLLQSGSGLTMTDQEYQTLLKYQMAEDVKNLLLAVPRIKSANAVVNPKEDQPYVFSPNASEASCAVMVELVGNEKLSQSEANTLINLISGSIAGIKAENITLSDTNLNQYSLSDVTITEEMNTTSEITYRIDLEDRIRNRLNEQIFQFLAPVFGETGFTQFINLELDFDDYSQKSVEFSPPVPDETEGMVRSMQEELKSTVDDETVEGIPGTDTNGMGSEEYPYGELEDGTRYYDLLRQYNYEIDELTTELARAKGYIKSLTIGVTIDSGIYPEDCRERVQSLVATAAGTNVGNVWVEQFVFPKAAEVSEEEIEKREAAERQRETIRLVTTIGIPVLLAIAILWLIYAIFKLFAPPKPEPQPILAGVTAGGMLDYAIGDDDMEGVYVGTAVGVSAAAAAAEEAVEEPEEDELFNYQDVEISAKLSGVLQLEKFIEKDPKAVAQLLRNWLTDDN